MYYYSDSISVILIVAGVLITTIASVFVNIMYSKYKKKENCSGLTGFDVARRILDKNNLKDVLVLETSGNLSDHYDPTKKVVKLSSDIYSGKTIAAIAVAAHECGHAIQDKENYSFLRLRAKIVPIVNLSSKLGYFAILIGVVMGISDLIWLGVAFELAILLFQLITLPVEFDASKRALSIIEREALVNPEEKKGAKKMLTSAALTYVAGVLSALFEIFRLVLMARNRD